MKHTPVLRLQAKRADIWNCCQQRDRDVKLTCTRKEARFKLQGAHRPVAQDILHESKVVDMFGRHWPQVMTANRRQVAARGSRQPEAARGASSTAQF
eukprot:6206319-Pleurochrysis_carterae.AAC.2